MKKFISYILFVFFILGCKQKATDNQLRLGLQGEDFMEFYNKFKSDSLFQINRVKFPWKIPTKDGKGLEITKSEWLYADFDYNDKYAKRAIDAYTQKIVTYGDTIKVEQRGVNNGIHIDFVFAKIDHKWFLYYETDLSK